MFSTAIDIAGAALLGALLLWLATTVLRHRAGTPLLLSLLTLCIVLPSLGHALEIRHGNLTTVAAGETIDDTLIAAGETVAVDGNVNGDLLAFGRRVTVRGNVSGDVITAAEVVTIQGTVGGNVIGFGRTLTLAGTRVAQNLYGFGRDVDVAADTDVGANALAFGENIDVNGRIGRDLTSFAANVTVSGTVQGDLEAFAGEVTLLPSARVSGNVTVHVGENDNLQVAGGAIVDGEIDRQIVEREQQRSRYFTFGYYVRQIVRLGAAFLTGLVLLWAFPGLRTLALPNATAALRAGGIGLATAVTLPVAALLACLTVIGLPLGIAAFLLGAIALYFAKAVVAQLIGRALFRNPTGAPHYAATLLVGLVVVIVAINLPFIGGFANLVLTLVGLGMIVSQLFGHFGANRPAHH